MMDGSIGPRPAACQSGPLSCAGRGSTVSGDVLIVGVSTRAAAGSAIRGGLRPRCVDLFADRDLAAISSVDRVDALQDCAAIAEAMPPCPWFYTGGLENHPAVVDRIARRDRLWGVHGEVLRRIRDPIEVGRILADAGLPVPDVRSSASGLPRDGTWLSKPIASGGGIGVRPLLGPEDPDDEPRYYQRRIEGPSYSALFIGAGGRSRLIGVVRQWIGGVPGRPFAYRGGIGPCRLEPRFEARLRSLGDRLATAFELVGWFGVDYVSRDGWPWPVEVNPRYTASVEIHERATGRALLPDHRDACEDGSLSEMDPPPRRNVVAKRILYAPRRLVFPAGEWPEGAIADIPAPGTIIEPGDPVLTLLVEAPDATTCRARLRRIRQAIGRMLLLG